MQFDPNSEGDIIVLGNHYSYFADSIELNIKHEGKVSIDRSITGKLFPAKKNIQTAGQDYSGKSYAIFGTHYIDTSISTYIYAVNQNYSGYSYRAKTNLPMDPDIFYWRRYRHAFNAGAFNGSANGIAANDNHIFCTDGLYLNAINKITHKPISTSYKLKNAFVAHASGIAVDPCNHVFVGGDSGNIFCLSFNGASFSLDTQIHLFATGDSFAATFITPYHCTDTSLNIKRSPVCGSILYAVLHSPDTASTYTFEWFDSTANKVVQSKTIKYKYGDTFSQAKPLHVYKLRIYRNIRIGGYYRDYPFEIFPRYDTLIKVSICQGDSFFHLGNSYASSMVINDTFQNQYGCDSAQQIQLTVLSKSYHFDTLFNCQGDSIFLYGKYRKQAGIYKDTLRNAVGCDSVLSTLLIVKPDTFTRRSFRLCKGDSIQVGSHFYSKSGVYRDSFLRYTGCDSVVETSLLILPDTAVKFHFDICSGDSIQVAGRWQKSTGSGIDTLIRSNGCDSVIQWAVDQHLPALTQFSAHLCKNDSTQLGGRSFRDSGNFEYRLKTQFGCDSVVKVSITQSNFTTQFTVDSTHKPLLILSRTTSGTFTPGRWWWIGDGLSRVAAPAKPDTIQFLWPTDNMFHTMKLLEKDQFGCLDSAEVSFFSPQKSIKFFNTFTPNGDGINDVFDFDTKGGDFTYSFYIFNRWGERIYAVENSSILDRSICWNGHVNNGNIECPEGNYFGQFYTHFKNEPIGGSGSTNGGSGGGNGSGGSGGSNGSSSGSNSGLGPVYNPQLRPISIVITLIR